ncbi:hypothetical protein SCP_0100330 [Sparassis crispa]|uniref:Uncharacterized protein n=1 Tax=Sparassis crispa TaxID=139825 RepID=A0A401G4R2_9APHY|nr:hypothetical protein SCP_0100330 [Sparassis crispa]GBE77161.1 hypothetical protein SCP_0100330 [Sparassis crispa]
MSGYATRSRNGQLNYCVLAGIQAEGQKPRRTSAQVVEERQQVDARRREAEVKRQAVAQRIAELEEEMAHQDVDDHEDAGRTLASFTGFRAGPSTAADVDAAGLREGNRIGANGGKAKKLSHADVEAAHKRKEVTTVVKKVGQGKENRAPVIGSTALAATRKRKAELQEVVGATEHHVKRSKATHTGVRSTWTPHSSKNTTSTTAKVKTSAASNGASMGGIIVNAGATLVEDSDEDDLVERVAVGDGKAIHPHTTLGVVEINPRARAVDSQPVERGPVIAVRHPNGSRKFTNTDLPIPSASMWVWHHQLILRYLETLGESASNPWNFTGFDLVAILQELWDEFFPDIPLVVVPREPVYDIAQQKVYEWRYSIAKAGVAAVSAFFEDEDNGLVTEEERAAYIRYVIGPNLPFRYAGATMKGQNGKAPRVSVKGAFQSTYVLRTLGCHFAATNCALDSNEPPCAALGLCLASVEHALRQYESGVFIKTDQKFSQDIHGRSTDYYMLSIASLREATWNKIINAAAPLARLSSIMPADLGGDEWDEVVDAEHGNIDDESASDGDMEI